jgi:hypothetical protein
VDVVWSQLFDKTASSGEKNVETKDAPLHPDSATKEEMHYDDTIGKLQFTQFTTPRYDSWSYQPRQLFQPNYNPWIPWQSPTDCLENHGYRMEDITKTPRESAWMSQISTVNWCCANIYLNKLANTCTFYSQVHKIKTIV